MCLFVVVFVVLVVSSFVQFFFLLFPSVCVSLCIFQPHKSLFCECGALDLIKQNNQWKLLKTLFIVKFNVILLFLCKCLFGCWELWLLCVRNTHLFSAFFCRSTSLTSQLMLLLAFIYKNQARERERESREKERKTCAVCVCVCQWGNFLLLILIISWRDLELG